MRHRTSLICVGKGISTHLYSRSIRAINQWEADTLMTLRVDWTTYDGEKTKSWSEKSIARLWLLEAFLPSLVQRTIDGRYGPSTSWTEANDWGHQMRTSTSRSRTLSKVRYTPRQSVEVYRPIRCQRLHHLAERNTDSPGSRTAWVKSDLDCQIKRDPILGKECVQKETEISSKTSC